MISSAYSFGPLVIAFFAVIVVMLAAILVCVVVSMIVNSRRDFEIKSMIKHIMDKPSSVPFVNLPAAVRPRAPVTAQPAVNLQQPAYTAVSQVSAPVAPAPLYYSPQPAVKKVPAKYTAGDVKLHSVSDKTVAMIMAIVADELKAPINELRFISIKELV